MKDATNAFSKYNLTIDVEPLVVALFPNATKLYLNWSENISISIDVESQYDVDAIIWNNDTTVKFINLVSIEINLFIIIYLFNPESKIFLLKDGCMYFAVVICFWVSSISFIGVVDYQWWGFINIYSCKPLYVLALSLISFYNLPYSPF